MGTYEVKRLLFLHDGINIVKNKVLMMPETLREKNTD